MSAKACILLVLLFVGLVLPASALSQSIDYGFVFLDFSSELQLPVGSSTVVQVSVKNVGEYSNIVELGIESTAPISASILPGSLTVEKDGTGVFTVSFLPSSSNQINKYPSKLRLKGRSVDLTRDFTIVLTPTAEKKFEINGNYIVLLNRYEALSKKFELVKSSGCVLVEAGDVTAITPKQIVEGLQDLNDKVEKTRIAIKENDFVTASVEEAKGDEIAEKLETDTSSLKSAQESCEEGKSKISGYLTGGAIGTTAGILVIAVVLGLAAYKHYKSVPRVRRLIRTPGYSISEKKESQQSGGVRRVEREFKYEFRKKK